MLKGEEDDTTQEKESKQGKEKENGINKKGYRRHIANFFNTEESAEEVSDDSVDSDSDYEPSADQDDKSCDDTDEPSAKTPKVQDISIEQRDMKTLLR